jgi:hypothetical protein
MHQKFLAYLTSAAILLVTWCRNWARDLPEHHHACSLDCSDFSFLTKWSITNPIWMKTGILGPFITDVFSSFKPFHAILASRLVKSDYVGKNVFGKFNTCDKKRMVIWNRLKKLKKVNPKNL